MKKASAPPIRTDRVPQSSPFCIGRRTLAIVSGLTLILGLSPAALAALRPLTISVVANGSIPGIADSDLPQFLVGTMNGASNGTWHFAPAPTGSQPPNRIVWSITTNASAAGSVRTYGFSRATMQRLLGVRQFLTIEVALYLNGQYQTQSLIEVTASGGASDPDLVADVTSGTKQLMSWAATNAK